MSTSDPVDGRRVLAQTAGVLLVAAALAFALYFGVVLVALFVGILLSAAVRPIVGLLERRTGRLVADAIVHVALVAGVLAFVLTALPILIEQIASIVADLPTYYAELRRSMLDTDSAVLKRLAGALPRTLTREAAPAAVDPMAAATAAVDWLATAGSATLTTTAVVLLSFYWTLEGGLITRSLLLLVPLERRAAAADLVEAAGDKLSGYVRGQLIVCAAVGALAFVAYWIIGLPNVFALALMAGVLEAVPVIGPILGAVPAAAVALTVDPSLVLWVGAATFVIQLAENYLLVPRVMDETVGVNPLVTLLAITGFGATLGIVGAILAIPLAALIQLVIERALASEETAPAAPAGRDQVSALRYQAQALALDVRKLVRAKESGGVDDDRVEDEVERIANDLDRVLGASAASAPRRRAADRQPTGGPP